MHPPPSHKHRQHGHTVPNFSLAFCHTGTGPDTDSCILPLLFLLLLPRYMAVWLYIHADAGQDRGFAPLLVLPPPPTFLPCPAFIIVLGTVSPLPCMCVLSANAVEAMYACMAACTCTCLLHARSGPCLRGCVGAKPHVPNSRYSYSDSRCRVSG